MVHIPKDARGSEKPSSHVSSLPYFLPIKDLLGIRSRRVRPSTRKHCHRTAFLQKEISPQASSALEELEEESRRIMYEKGPGRWGRGVQNPSSRASLQLGGMSDYQQRLPELITSQVPHCTEEYEQEKKFFKKSEKK